MYAYIYDAFVTGPRFASLRDRVETRLSRLGIQGNIRRVTVLHPLRSAVVESARTRATTIVMVGNDESILRSLDALAVADRPIGIIPVGNPAENCIAQTLGIPMGELACDVLARRRILPVDLGLAGSRLFLTRASIHADRIVCTGDNGAFRISSIARGVTLTITNIAATTGDGTHTHNATPCDGFLEVEITKKKRALRRFFFTDDEQSSCLPMRRLTITEPAGGSLLLDGVTSVSIPTTITVANVQLRCIVGRRLAFHDPLIDTDAPDGHARSRKRA